VFFFTLGPVKHTESPILHPAIDFVHRRMHHSYFAPDAQQTFPSTDSRQ